MATTPALPQTVSFDPVRSSLEALGVPMLSFRIIPGQGAGLERTPRSTTLVLGRELLLLPSEQLHAIIAHEVGHLRLGHLGSGRLYWTLSAVLIVLMGHLSLVAGMLVLLGVSLLGAHLRRREEFSADHWAGQHTSGHALAVALETLQGRDVLPMGPVRSVWVRALFRSPRRGVVPSWPGHCDALWERVRSPWNVHPPESERCQRLRAVQTRPL